MRKEKLNTYPQPAIFADAHGVAAMNDKAQALFPRIKPGDALPDALIPPEGEQIWEGAACMDGRVYQTRCEQQEQGYLYTFQPKEQLALSDGQLDFTNIDTDFSGTNWKTGIGTAKVHFTFNGEKHTVSAAVNNDWFDPAFLDELNEIIAQADGKQLYFTSDSGQGLLLFYRDAQWAKEFTKLTGMKLYTNTDDIEFGL